MKKIAALTIALMLALTTLIACGGEETTAEPALPTTEEVVHFIDQTVYPKTPDFIPMMTETRELDLTDMDSVSYFTGLTSTDGITSIIVSESGVGSIAYSMLYVRTDGTTTDTIQTTLGTSVNPQKWVCVWADKVSSVRLDNDIVLIMGEPSQVEAIMGAVVESAQDVFTNIGEVVNVIG